jgi:hypothetical protein
MSGSLILINSSNYDQTSGICNYKFPSPFRASNLEVALVNSSFYNCFFNVSAELKNNVYVFTFYVWPGPAATTYTLTLNDGYYTFDQLNYAFQSFFIQQKLYAISSSGNVYFYTLLVNSSQYGIQLTSFYLPTTAQATTLGWTLPAGAPQIFNNVNNLMYYPFLTLSGQQEYLGIPNGNYPSTVTPNSSVSYLQQAYSVIGPNAPQVDKVTSVIIRCNMISNSSIGNPVDMLAQIPVVGGFGAINSSQINYPLYSVVGNTTYQDIQLSFMDQNQNLIKFKDPSLSFTLFIRPILRFDKDSKA